MNNLTFRLHNGYLLHCIDACTRTARNKSAFVTARVRFTAFVFAKVNLGGCDGHVGERTLQHYQQNDKSGAIGGWWSGGAKSIFNLTLPPTISEFNTICSRQLLPPIRP